MKIHFLSVVVIGMEIFYTHYTYTIKDKITEPQR